MSGISKFFSIKDQVLGMLHFASSTFSVTSTELCCRALWLSLKAAIHNILSKILLRKTAVAMGIVWVR